MEDRSFLKAYKRNRTGVKYFTYSHLFFDRKGKDKYLKNI